jgi:hypothetical protein
MPIAKSQMGETVQAGVGALTTSDGRVKLGGVFKVECFGPDGQKKWEDIFHNLVVNEGLQDLNSKYFKASGYTAAWYLGLINGPGSGTTYSANDTLATHGGWTEDTNYSGSRKAVTFGTPTLADPSVIDNSGSPAVFNINNTTTVAGAFLATVASGTSGILFSEGDFTGGDKLVASGDTLNVTYTFSADAV